MFDRPNISTFLVLLTGAAGFLSACNLAIDTSAYPFERSIVIDTDTDGLDGGMKPDLSHDMPHDAPRDADELPDGDAPDIPQGEPELIFTELMVDTDDDSLSPITGEFGEYIEVKNIGDGPANPRNIIFQVRSVTNDSTKEIYVSLTLTPEHRAAYEGLELIEPGDYFVFVRYEVPGVPLSENSKMEGKFWDYGKFGSGDVSLGNSGEREIYLQYIDDDGNTIDFDYLRWSSGKLRAADDADMSSLAIVQNHAWSVKQNSETSSANDSPANWCEEVEPVSGGTFLGSPGRPARCF